MSSGHQHRGAHGYTAADLDGELDRILKMPAVKRRLARPFKLVTTYDMPLLGSSSIGGANVYLDRHLRANGRRFGVLLVNDYPFDTKPPLIRHERLEQAIEDVLGWQYEHAHLVATRWEHRIVPDPAAYERALKPLIKKDALERVTRVPGDLDIRPLLAPPVNRKMLAAVREAMERSKASHEKAGYVDMSPHRGRHCGNCSMFAGPEYGGPACTKVRDKIRIDGWCRWWA